MLSLGACRMGLDALGKFFRRRRRRPVPIAHKSSKKSSYSVISHDRCHSGTEHFLVIKSFLDPVLDLCRVRRKRLYVLPGIDPKWVQSEKCFFQDRLRLRSTTLSEMLNVGRGRQVCEQTMKER